MATFITQQCWAPVWMVSLLTSSERPAVQQPWRQQWGVEEEEWCADGWRAAAILRIFLSQIWQSGDTVAELQLNLVLNSADESWGCSRREHNVSPALLVYRFKNEKHLNCLQTKQHFFFMTAGQKCQVNVTEVVLFLIRSAVTSHYTDQWPHLPLEHLSLLQRSFAAPTCLFASNNFAS